MENKKFVLTKETATVNGAVTYRIKALKNFGNVHSGDLGGFVEKEDNLSQHGNCWVYDNAKVFGESKIKDNAIVKNDALVKDSCLRHSSEVCDTAHVLGMNLYADTLVGGNTNLKGGCVYSPEQY